MDFTRLTDFLTKNLLWILLLLAGAIIYFAPIQISSDIPIAGKVFPAKRWVLRAGSNGQIINTEIDLVAGISNVYESREFERGDDVRFEISPEVLSKSQIRKNDRVGQIYSNNTHILLNVARNELKVEKALLETYRTGVKKEEVEYAEKRLEYARVDAEIQMLEYNRQKLLYEQDVITDQEFEDQERNLRLKQAQVAINEAEVQTLMSGSKQADIEYAQARVDKIKGDIVNLEGKLLLQSIISPMDGIFRNSFSSDTLMVIESVDEFIIKMPVSLSERSRIYLGQEATCMVHGEKAPFSSEVVHISNHISVVAGKQIFIATAVIRNSETELLPGVIFKGKLRGDKILLRDYVAKWFGY